MCPRRNIHIPTFYCMSHGHEAATFYMLLRRKLAATNTMSRACAHSVPKRKISLQPGIYFLQIFCFSVEAEAQAHTNIRCYFELQNYIRGVI